jgi:uncharacterized membrane protein
MWVSLFGDGEVALRAPSALAGVVFCWAIWWLTRLRLGERAAVTAALLSAVSPLLVYYSREARAYSLLSLVMLWVAHAWTRLVAPDDVAARDRYAPAHAGLAAAAAG